jgi:predicted ATP-dependent serine protease
MNLRCQHCGERIIARSFGKCPGCYRDLPEELLLNAKEKEMEEMEEKRRKKEESMSG